MLAASVLALGGPAGAAPAKEYQVKAAFLFNFAQFVEWPKTAFSRPEDPFVIGVLGPDPFGSYLEDVAHGEKVGGRKIVVKRYGKAADAFGSQILWVAGKDMATMMQDLAVLRNKPVLTVGDADGFAVEGGVIRLVMKQNKIRFRINVEAAQASGLSISAKLLSLADIVAPGKG